MQKEETVLPTPEPIILFLSFGTSSIDLVAVGTVANPSIKAQAIHNLIKEIDKRFKEENIEIPFPQTDVYLHKEN
jgi:potassium efflux system protein